jgi:hypothetical protein
MRLTLFAHLVLAALLWSGCEHYEKPNKPIPRDFRVRTLTGEIIDRTELKGRAWVIGLWVPG